MSAAAEPPADEDPNINLVNNDGEDQGKNVSDTETEPAMLDEEEMPSYLSLASLPVLEENRAEQNAPSKSELPAPSEERTSSPYASEQGAESVCVLSSGEESDRKPYGTMLDYDSDEMDMEEEEEQEEEEEEEEDDSCMNDEEESDGDIEPEQFERSSDDFVLRYDSGLEKHHKERSRSLQDLTNSHGNLSRFVGKRRSIDLIGSSESEFPLQVTQTLEDPLALRKKMPRSVNYDHIPSKVKLYIREMKEQRRRSAERMNRENPLPKGVGDANSRGDSADVTRAATMQNPENKRIKIYVEHAIKELTTKDVVSETRHAEHNTIQERREELPDINNIEEMETEKDNFEMETNEIPENLTLASENLSKKLKANGLVEYNEKVVELSKTKETNGEEQIATILNLRTLSYEEYTNGDENSEAIVENLSRPRAQEKNAVECLSKNSGSEIAEPEVHETSYSSRKEDEKSSRIGSKEPRCNWNLRELTLDASRRKVAQVDSEVYQKMLDENVNLKLELEEMKQTLEQCRSANHPKEVYERTLAENASLRLELEEMRKKLEQFRAANVQAETRIASVQTEIAAGEKMDTTEAPAKPTVSMQKLFSSTATSAQSSIEQWSDSNCSAAISIDPPNIEAALNADDSLALGDRSTSKPSHVLSHSFVTSSRILQTLANITQGRTRTSTGGQALSNSTRKNAHAEPQGQSKRQTFDPISTTNEEAHTSRAKKRKASDMLDGPHAHLETFKIPHTSGDTRRKINSDSNTDTTYNLTEQGATNNYKKTAKNPDDNDQRRTEDVEDDNDPPDTPHNVKYFVYHDEPDTKERSFLIQAEESPKNTGTIDKGGNVRECGPFLLGNVEIRMSETNGTINIWGKELSQPTEEGEVETGIEEAETENSPAFLPRQPFVCQSTPYPKCANHNILTCSSTKKARISPKFSRSGIGKYFRSAATNLTRAVNNPVNQSHFGHSLNSSLSDNSRMSHCEHCESHQKRIKTPSYEYLANSRTKHSCCLHNPEGNEKDGECPSDNEVFDESTMYETMSNILANHEKYANSFANLMSKNHCINATSGEKCRHHTSPGPRSSGREQDSHQTHKRCSSCTDDLPSCSRRLAPTTQQCHENSSRSHSHVSCEEEDHPLLFNESPSETPETKRRRLSGKKVRGILTDLLRGCSGCRDPNSTSSLPRATVQSAVPKVHVTPCTPPVPSCSKRANPSPSHPHRHPSSESVRERCCSSCSRPAEVRAQIESELEVLRSTMEQLLARSHALLEGLNLL